MVRSNYRRLQTGEWAVYAQMIYNEMFQPCEIAHRRKLEEISHAKHC